MPSETILSERDSRLILYRDLKDKRLYKEHDLFCAEGEYLVKRLVQSDFEVHSILATPAKASAIDFCNSETELYLTSEEIISTIVGFDFHRGVLALGKRKADMSLQQVKTRWRRIVVCPEINDVDNLGAIVRNAVAFATDFMLLGPQCADPFHRRALRASMGAVFKIPIIRSADLMADIQALKARKIQLLASVVDEKSVPLSELRVGKKYALFLGNEATGLEQKWREQCDSKVMIPLDNRIDSCNVAVASGIFLFYLQTKSC